MRSYLIVIQKAAYNYAAYSPDVLGCVATGESVEETIRHMNEALEFHLEGMAEDGDSLPHPKGLAFYMEQSAPFAEPNDLLTHVEVQLPEAA